MEGNDSREVEPDLARIDAACPERLAVDAVHGEGAVFDRADRRRGNEEPSDVARRATRDQRRREHVDVDEIAAVRVRRIPRDIEAARHERRSNLGELAWG